MRLESSSCRLVYFRGRRGVVPKASRSAPRIRIIGEVMATTMTGGVHENPHGYPHRSKKIEKSVMNANVPGPEGHRCWPGRSMRTAKHQLKGFMVPIMRGS